MNAKLTAELKSLLGRDRVRESPEDLVLASYDGTELSGLPVVVARPCSTGEVSRTLKFASDRGIPVTPRGAASGLSGGAVPAAGGIALDMERMNKIISISKEDAAAVAEPGILVADFQRELGKHGLFYPPDPSSASFSTLGGNVAECAGGLRALKYGVTRDYVLALEAVLADGTVIHTGSAAHKTVAGYDLTRLLVGSEGTLAVFTKITVRLLPLPAEVALVAAYFGTPESGAGAAIELLKEGFFPRAVEFMDETSVNSVLSAGEVHAPEGTGSCLLVETDGPQGYAREEARTIAEFLRGLSPLDVRLATDERERDRLWDIRRQISPALYNVTGAKVSEDVCVPRSKMVELLGRLRSISRERGVRIASYGHAGDGNLHVNILDDERSANPREKLSSVISDVFEAALALGGTISGEHGIGLAKRDHLDREVGGAELSLMKSIKRLFDPAGILNPGKIFKD
jgi:glycolate oxidase